MKKPLFLPLVLLLFLIIVASCGKEQSNPVSAFNQSNLSRGDVFCGVGFSCFSKDLKQEHVIASVSGDMKSGDIIHVGFRNLSGDTIRNAKIKYDGSDIYLFTLGTGKYNCSEMKLFVYVSNKNGKLIARHNEKADCQQCEPPLLK